MTAVITVATTVDAVHPADRAALERFFERCSRQTVYRRFFAPLRRFPAAYLDAVLTATPRVHDAVVARCAGGLEIAGLASLAAVSSAPQTGELGVLVADAWQGRGLGAAMTDRLVERARRRGLQRLSACVLPEQAALLQALERHLEMAAASRESDSLTGVYQIG